MKKLIKKLVNNIGYEVIRLKTDSPKVDDGVSAFIPDAVKMFSQIPGMISVENGTIFYFIAYTQSIKGNIVEIGSWQGRSTSFFAKSCKDSGNGIVFAIDPFLGNPGKEHFYVVNKDDLSDLKENFQKNINTNGLSEYVKLFPMTSEEAREHINEDIRLLFIDGNHEYEFVKRDIQNFVPLLKSGGIVIFDDYNSVSFPGVVQAVKEDIIESPQFTNYVQTNNVFIATKK